MTSYIRIFPGWVLLLLPLPLLAQGYSIEGNRIVVDGPEQWKQWTHPRGTLVFEDDGFFHPIHIHKDINACLDAPAFVHDDDIRGGIRDAGSNPGDAVHVMDGDLRTYWEPDRSDTLSDWWIQIDLGRLVAGTKIVVKFVEEGKGDPFLGFKVWTSPDGEWWREAGRVTSNREEKREFAFELSPPEGNEGEGDQVQYVWVMATETDGEKKEEVTREEYDALDAGWRGAIEYYRIGPTGEELLIREKGYYALPEEQRGRIRYYRREIPRLAGVEVWSIGDNIALGLLDQRGSVGGPVPGGWVFDASDLMDGTFATTANVPKLGGRWWDYGIRPLVIDLGATYWVDEVRLITEPPQNRSLWVTPRGYRVRVSELPGAVTEESQWQMMTAERRFFSDSPRGPYEWFFGPHNHGIRAAYIQETFELRTVRSIDLVFSMDAEYERVREIQIYGEGYVSEITMISPLISLGTYRRFGAIRWEPDMPSGTDIEVRTRTGDNLREVTHYFDKGGTEITQMRYVQLPGFARGETKTEYVPAEGWSDWSRPYQHPGDLITSPSPRQYLQIQITFLSDDPNVCASLSSLWIDNFTPLAHSVTGEIFPSQIARAGVRDTLSLFLHPSFLPDNPGFDGVLVHSPFPIEMKLVNLRIGSEQGFLENTSHTFLPEEVHVLSTSPDSLFLHLPERIIPGGADLLEVQFETTIFLENTSFEAFLLNSSYPDSPQKVDEGDATALVDNQTMHVEIPMNSRIIRDVEIHPSPFTPNGDGINDEVTVSFNVFRIFTQKTVRVGIYDISGWRVRELVETREVGSGRYEMVWDGRDVEGRVVRPGVYVVRIHAGVDVPGENADHYTCIRSVGVVY